MFDTWPRVPRTQLRRKDDPLPKALKTTPQKMTPRPTSAADRLRRNLKMKPLDRILINAIVDARQGVDGALQDGALHEAVDEFVRLNGRRHQSYFHSGLRDVMFNRPVAKLPADNATRRRWYWAGAIFGWARTEDWQRIAQAYIDEQTVRDLGDGIDRASKSAGLQVAKALWKTNQSAQLPTFVRPRLAKRTDVHRMLSDAATEALRRDQVGVAKQLFALLMECSQGKVHTDVAASAPTVRRRMAHCLRLLGEHSQSQELLQALLEERIDVNNQAMVLADLGLLKGHFRLLDDVHIPSDGSARQDIVERLEAGETEFRGAAHIEEAPFAAHGHYCLGVLALADDRAGEGRYDTAYPHLEQAIAHFQSRPTSYPASLIPRTALYLGIAKIQLLTAAQMRHGTQLISEGLVSGVDLPTHFIAPTINALSLSDLAIDELAALLLEAGGDEALDALTQPGMVSELPIVAEKLLQRTRRPHQKGESRAADLRLALARFLRLNNVEQAVLILDELEELALGGCAVEAFLEILDTPERYDPAWDADDAARARHRLLDVRGDYVLALGALRTTFFRSIHGSTLLEAEGILDWARSRPLDERSYADMLGSYAAARGSEPDAAADEQRGPVAVLVIGGDESQASSTGQVLDKVGQQDSSISLEFIATNWSNWSRTLDDVQRRLPSFNAVVLSRLVRTTLGQHVRRLCSKHNIPWRFCYGAGQGTRVRAIMAAASAGRATGRR